MRTLVDPRGRVTIGVAQPRAGRRPDGGLQPWMTHFGDAEWHDLSGRPASAGRQARRLHGRLLAKRAVQQLLKAATGSTRSLSEITILSDQAGAPRVVDPGGSLGQGFVVSVSHTDTLTTATAALATLARGVGIDVESYGRGEAILRHGLTEQERALVTASGEALPPEVLFTAKEAAVKAWGTGFDPQGGPGGVGTTMLTTRTVSGHTRRHRVRVRSALPGLPPLNASVTEGTHHVMADAWWPNHSTLGG